MKPFNPDFIPAVGDIDAFLKVRRQIINGHRIQMFWSLLVNLLKENEYSLELAWQAYFPYKGRDSWLLVV